MIDAIYNFLCSKKILTAENEDEKEIYLFALDVIVYTSINVIIILIASFFINSFFPSVIFLLLFSLLQTTGGGYHANSHIGCILSTTLTWAIYILLYKFIPLQYNGILFFVVCICMLLISFVGPVEHPNAPVTKNQYKKHKKRLIILLILLFIIQTILFFIFPCIFSLIAYIIILYFLSIMIAFFIRKKEKSPLDKY